MQSWKSKSRVVGLLITSLFAYLEWGGDNSMFLWQGEIEIIKKFIEHPGSVVHPFIILPMLGQVLLLISLFLKHPNKWMLMAGIACIAILIAFMFIAGLLSLRFKILLSTLPFLVLAIWTINTHFFTSRTSSSGSEKTLS